jgi:anaerobic magnesium-protoporphyrin IX monomethyl ester cyclase
MRVLLVKTSAVGAAHRPPAPPCVIAPLGIMYLASSIRKAFGPRVNVEIESLSTAAERVEDIPSFLKRHRPDVVGISSALTEEREAAEICRHAARLEPRPFIVIGGPYPTCSTSRALRSTGADCAVVGEGEVTFVNLVEALMKGGGPAGIPGTATLDAAGVLQVRAPAEFVRDLDSLAHPAWDLIPIETYSGLFNMNDMPPLYEPYVPMMTSRGCPYRCSFCHNIFGKRFRGRSPENVLEEMELLHDRFGVREFHFIDDVFNYDGERLEKICSLIARRGLRIALAFPNAIRGDILTRKQIGLLRRAGCYSITMALESASPRLQKLMRKNLNLEKLARNARIASSLGMITSCYVMFGYPSETEEEMETTLQWVRNSFFDFPRFCIASPFPGTLMGDHARMAGFDPETMDPDRAQYDLLNPGLASMPPDKFRRRFRSGIEEIFQEPRRQKRLASIWPLRAMEQWHIYGLPRT